MVKHKIIQLVTTSSAPLSAKDISKKINCTYQTALLTCNELMAQRKVSVDVFDRARHFSKPR
jgi:hypothetical protein